MAVIKRKVSQKNSGRIEPKTGVSILIKPLFVLLCASLLYYVYAHGQDWLERLDSKPISSFALIGTPRFTTDADIRDSIFKMDELKGFFAQDVNQVREQIETLPWIKNVVVKKIWPDKLSIWVAEYTPVAIWNKNNFLSDEGVIFQLPMSKLRNNDLPRLAGPDYQSATVLSLWHQIYRELKSNTMVLKGLTVDERGAWEIIVDDEITLKLGRGSDWKQKIDRFVTIYPQIEVPEHKKIDYVDLRYKVGAAVSFTDN